MGEIQQVAQKTANSRAGEAFIRLGHAIRGGLYVVMGILAVEWALGYRHQAPGTSQAINVVGQSPFGKILLIFVILGLVGYAGWGLVRMTWKKSWPTRIGYFFSAVGYGSLVIPAISLLQNQTSVPDAGWSKLMITAGTPIGRIILVVAGLGIIVGAFTQVKQSLDEDWLMKFGLWGRSGMLFLAGLFLILAGWYADPNSPHSFAQVLVTVTQWSFGPLIVIFIGLGLIALGVYSLLLAKRNEHTR